MPVRSTLFQRAVYYIKAHLEQEQYAVQESRELIDRSSGAKREVDVVLEATIGGHSIIISLECRERGRKADVPWVECMWGKHVDLPTNRLVLVSLTGFTEPARRKAQRFGIELLEPEQITETNAARVVRDLTRLRLAKVRSRIDKVYFKMAATEYRDAMTVEAQDDWAIKRADGSTIFNVAQFVEHSSDEMFTRPEFATVEMDYFGYRYEFRPNVGAEGDGTSSVYLEQNNPEKHLIEIERVCITGRITFKVGAFDLTRGVLQGVSHAYGEGVVDGARAAAYLTALTDDKATVTFEIEES